MKGPQPVSRAERLKIAEEIAQRARELHGAELLAVGVYGSVARGTDGPYSDLEMLCVLREGNAEYSYEWSAGPWKAEVDFYSAAVLLTKAAEVEGRWPLTHGAFATVLPLYDPESFFTSLAAAATGGSPEQFKAAIEEALVGELYEWIGKLRNGNTAYQAELAIGMAKYTAFILGLHHRRLFTTGPRVLEEALTLPDQPAGFDQLCDLVMTGRLHDPAPACETLWTGLEAWAARNGYTIHSGARIPF